MRARFLMGNYWANVLDYGVFVKNADESKEVHVYPDVYKPPFKHTYLLANLLIKIPYLASRHWWRLNQHGINFISLIWRGGGHEWCVYEGLRLFSGFSLHLSQHFILRKGLNLELWFTKSGIYASTSGSTLEL